MGTVMGEGQGEEERSQNNYPGEVAFPKINCEKKTMTAQTSPDDG